MIKGMALGIKVFCIFFAVLFILNIFEIRIFAEALYTSEGIFLAALFCMVNGIFVRL